MKVGTDGVLLGAWVDVAGVGRILDIGTGTGLIALMLAQRSSAHIDAIEIETAAAHQAHENVQRSPWADRVQVHQTSLQGYRPNSSHRYDLIVANPPFFQQALPARNVARSLARHGDQLAPLDLVQAAARLIADRGRLAVIYPVETAQHLLKIAAEHGLSCRRQLNIKPKPHLPVKRLALELSRDRQPTETATLIIENETRHHYTSGFVALIKPFYLNY